MELCSPQSQEIAANGGDLATQADGLERELRGVHARLDAVLLAVDSLVRSPAMTPELESVVRDAIEPASRAIESGAARLRERVLPRERVAGW